MSELRVAPIVEGHAEVEAVRILLERVWYEILEGDFIEVLRPIRRPRGELVRDRDLIRAVQLGGLLLDESSKSIPGLTLLLIDADRDLPCLLAPRLTGMVHQELEHLDFACILANSEWETWFVAAAESLSDYLDLPAGQAVPEDPEARGLKKAWIQERFRGKYSPKLDQPRLTARMDLTLCRRRSPSFDKLCRELENRLQR